MSDNVDLAKRANAAFNAADADAFMELVDPDAEMLDLANAPDQQSAVKGREAIRGAWELWVDAFDELRAEITEYTAAGDCVICDVHWIGQGKGSGISIDLRQFDLYEFRDGRWISGILGIKSKQEALDIAAERAATG